MHDRIHTLQRLRELIRFYVRDGHGVKPVAVFFVCLFELFDFGRTGCSVGFKFLTRALVQQAHLAVRSAVDLRADFVPFVEGLAYDVGT